MNSAQKPWFGGVRAVLENLLRTGFAVPVLLALSACASNGSLTNTEPAAVETPVDTAFSQQVFQDSKTPSPGEPVADMAPVTELTPELLFDVLVAAVASQRRQPEVALDALERAVYRSRNRRLNANAIELALHIRDYPKAIELSQLLLIQDPDNFRVALALATAQIRNEALDDAANTLLELVRGLEMGKEPMMQEVASLIARQKQPARDQLRQILDDAAQNNDPLLMFTSALLASRLEEPDRFRDLLDDVLEIEPTWETAAILKLTDIADRERDMVDDWASEYIRANPRADRFRVQYARLLIQDDRLEEALDEFNAALDINPDAREALFAAAVVNMDLDQEEDAETLLRRYISGSDNGDQARLYLAQMLIEQERYDDASPLLRQIQSNQFYLDAQIALSGVIAKQSNVEAGLSYLRNIDARGEDESIRLILEQDLLLRDFDQMDRSLELLTEALEERPEQPDLLYSRGLLAAQMNKIDLIERDMRLLIELQPENAHAYNALGYTLADQTNRFDEALELITRALEYLPEDPYILDSMGWVQYRLGNLEEAMDYLQQAWDLKKDAEIAAHLGEVLWVLGRHEEAREIWKQGKETGPENATLLKTIDRLTDTDTDQRAVRALQPAAAFHPEFPIAA